jgi:hypothetical protein
LRIFAIDQTVDDALVSLRSQMFEIKNRKIIVSVSSASSLDEMYRKIAETLRETDEWKQIAFGSTREQSMNSFVAAIAENVGGPVFSRLVFRCFVNQAVPATITNVYSLYNQFSPKERERFVKIVEETQDIPDDVKCMAENLSLKLGLNIDLRSY